ncbi:hypothetical protein [Falsiroseomonas selenitidurans]|uniref:Phosphodiester glycosidase domain-containing protein n=1 Tax=Falsiroseomonas selenitidurans TaxID=2716335 RepID=A0ABX1E6L5_9PROT|nr:hypothetical protein [Falsiroseomonas selenitidurans]NKC31448.1 hypothetical protein [Falsiroseomonas selenitidurans]
MSGDFFIGWAATPPRALRGVLLGAGLAVGLGLPAAGLLLGATAQDPAPPGYATVPGRPGLPDLPSEEALRGVILDGPSPLLQLPGGRTLILADDGKYGPTLDRDALRGRMVAAEGFVLRRGSIEMLVLRQPPTPLDDVATVPPPEPLGRWRITGEICDGKCAGGAMQPGIGIGHRACATLCLDGGIPAVFVATAPVAGHAFLVLGDATGGPALPAMRDLIGRRVTLEGAVLRQGNTLVFHAAMP